MSRIIATGASGLVGRAIARRLDIAPLSRRAGSSPWWDPLGGEVKDDGEPFAAVLHLAGEPVASRWTASKQKRIFRSRVEGSRTIVSWLRNRKQRPSVLVCASGIGYYGDRGDELLDEESSMGGGFLAGVVQAWEAECLKAEEAGVRVVCLRMGAVLSTEGGALGKLLPVFRAGAGGPVGSGRQWFPWIHVEDAAAAFEWAVRTPAARGVYNTVAPGLVRQKAFSEALGAALGRPSFVPAPAAAIRLAFGQMGSEMLLGGQRAEPRRLLEDGFSFQYAELQSVLEKKEPRIYILDIPFEKEDFIFSSEDFYGCDDEDTHVHEHFIDLRKEYINNEVDIVHFEGGEEPSSIVMKPERAKILSCIIGKEKIEAFIEKFEEEFIPYDDYEKRNSVVKDFLTPNKQRRRNKP